MSSKTIAAGHTLWAKMPKANAELFALTYGSLVMEIVRDYADNVEEINTQLERIGHSIGVRCVDELLAKGEVNGLHIPTCANLRDTAEVIAKIGFRMFLGVTCEISNFGADGNSFSLFMYENPIAIFVELPPPPSDGTAASSNGVNSADLSQLQYSNIYCGVIRGALEQVNMKVDCQFVRDMLKGDEVNEIRVQLKEIMTDGAGEDYTEE
mmetsp:Transcript_19233/g.27053  ORF Transcript_19233/g.27053 Transcript_19233/m.27053 type:complete len:210 (+) Transcript_19233:50-679(+)